jgi:hypothetical protein
LRFAPKVPGIRDTSPEYLFRTARNSHSAATAKVIHFQTVFQATSEISPLLNLQRVKFPQ